MSMSEDRNQLYGFAHSTFTHEFGVFVRSANITTCDAIDILGERVEGIRKQWRPRLVCSSLERDFER